MNRARSPLFFLSMVLLVGIGVSIGLMFGLGQYEPEASAYASWVATFLCFPLGGLLLAELAIRLGWEPRWLRARYVGVLILDKEADGLNGQTGWLTVSLPNKELERFYADHEEFPLVEKYQLVTLEVIGQYVADVRRMKGRDVEAIEGEAAKTVSQLRVRRDSSLIKPVWARPGAWVWMIAAPLVAGLLIGTGIASMICDGEAGSYVRYPSHLSGGGSQGMWPSLITIAIGVFILGFNLILWRRGWDDYDIPTGYRRRWWYWDDDWW